MNIESALASLDSEMPGQTKDAVSLGTGLVDGFATFDSPVGEVVVGFNVVGVSFVGLAEGFEPDAPVLGKRVVEATPPRAWGARIDRAIERGQPGDLPLDLRSVTEFQRSVLNATAKIPFGQVRPYGWLASSVGNPGAVRAVGSTMAKNPVPLIVPCHRVVRSDGRIGNYSLGGPRNKTELLGHEGVDVDALTRLAAKNVRYLASDTTGIFCHPTCSHARRITDAHRVELRSSAEALQSGFRPCKVCRPA